VPTFISAAAAITAAIAAIIAIFFISSTFHFILRFRNRTRS
jgi:hypothetical protein